MYFKRLVEFKSSDHENVNPKLQKKYKAFILSFTQAWLSRDERIFIV